MASESAELHKYSEAERAGAPDSQGWVLILMLVH